MTEKIFIVLIAAFFNAAYVGTIEETTSADQDIYIYGTVETDDGETYTGQIRWGKEEAFWFDYFNSSKPENEYLDYLSRADLKHLDKERNNHNFLDGLVTWNNGNSDHTHSFACQFGDIKSIEVGRRERVELTFKNGHQMRLEGGSNDIGTEVQVTDSEIGHIKIKWKNIEKVTFENAPSSFESHYGAPLYGTVTSESGETFTGFVQWDHDERLAHDVLNGETRDGDMDIEFGNISKLEKTFRGTEVTMKSGRNFELRGTNDVDDGNRGIIVNIPGKGRVDIPWDEFEMVEFSTAKMGVVDYGDFDGGIDITASVTTESGDTHKGRIAYDLDETYQFEILNGKKDGIEYFIPFHLVKEIKPKGRRSSIVTLKSGDTIRLEDSVDIDEGNDGILIFENDDDPIYVRWEDVASVNL